MTTTTAPEQVTPRTDPSAEQGDSAERIDTLRERIDAVDTELASLWQERAALSREVGAARVAAGGTRLVLAREQAIVDKFRAALGADGVKLAMLLLRAGRGGL